MRKALFAIALLVGSLMSTALWAQESVQLAYRFSPGQVLDYEMTFSGAGTTSVAPLEPAGARAEVVPMEFSGTMALVQRTAAVHPDGSADLELSSGGMKMKFVVTPPGQPKQQAEITIAKGKLTVKTPEKTETKTLEEMGMGPVPFLATPLQVRMAQNGRILSFSGAGMEKLAEMLPGFDISQMMRASETVLPERPVAPGDTWEYKVEIPVPGAEKKTETLMRAVLSVVLPNGEGPTAVISISGAVALSGMVIQPPGPEGQPALKITFDKLTQNITGAMNLGLDLGQVTRATYDTQISMAMTAPAGPEGQPPSKVTTEMKMRMEMRLKR